MLSFCVGVDPLIYHITCTKNEQKYFIFECKTRNKNRVAMKGWDVANKKNVLFSAMALPTTTATQIKITLLPGLPDSAILLNFGFCTLLVC